MIASSPSFLAPPPERPGELARGLPYPHIWLVSCPLICHVRCLQDKLKFHRVMITCEKNTMYELQFFVAMV